MTGVRWLLPVVWCLAACRAPAPAPVVSPPAPAPVAPPASLSEWPAALAAATRAAEAGDFAGADRILMQFGLRYPGTAEGAESDFWRALFKADPSNTEPTSRERVALLDAYLSAGGAAPRYLEAMVLRRLLESVDSTRSALASLRAIADVRQRAREDEIRKLSDDLDRAMAELERIKKRLAPKPPG